MTTARRPTRPDTFLDVNAAAIAAVNPFVADPANPTDEEIVASIGRSLAAGKMVEVTDEWLAEQRAELDADPPAADVASDVEAGVARVVATRAGKTSGAPRAAGARRVVEIARQTIGQRLADILAETSGDAQAAALAALAEELLA